jgi:hypothetical protein
MAGDTEKLELLFRRQLAIETARATKPSATYRLEAVSSLHSDRSSGLEPSDATRLRRFERDHPPQRLVPSAGFFNAARVPATAQTWLLTVGAVERGCFEKLLTALLNIQSLKRSFRFVFILDDSEYLEILRHYGLTFEVIAHELYAGITRERQIEVFRRKWGASLCLDLDHVRAEEISMLH